MADEKDMELAKAKAAAAAKAKAAALAKAKAAQTGGAPTNPPVVESKEETPVVQEATTAEAPTPAASGDDAADAKAKAIAAAKAKAAAAAAAKAKAMAGGDEAPAPASDAVEGDDKAKAIAAAKAKAAAIAAAKAKAAGGVAPTEAGTPVEGAAPAPVEEKPSKNRPVLDLIVKKITETLGSNVIEESYINFLAKEVPTFVIKKERWLEMAQYLHDDAELDFKYLSNLTAIDHETHMEVYNYLQSYTKGYLIAVRVKTDRNGGTLPSVTSVWPGANWQEREVYDLLGITFTGHPDLKRMFLPEDWVGHPLRKDYVQYDEEV